MCRRGPQGHQHPCSPAGHHHHQYASEHQERQHSEGGSSQHEGGSYQDVAQDFHQQQVTHGHLSNTALGRGYRALWLHYCELGTCGRVKSGHAVDWMHWMQMELNGCAWNGCDLWWWPSSDCKGARTARRRFCGAIMYGIGPSTVHVVVTKACVVVYPPASFHILLLPFLNIRTSSIVPQKYDAYCDSMSSYMPRYAPSDKHAECHYTAPLCSCLGRQDWLSSPLPRYTYVHSCLIMCIIANP